jgi:hypothetical protein
VRVCADAKLQLLHASGASAGEEEGGEGAEAGGSASSGRLRESAGGSGGVRRWSHTASREHCNSCNMLQVAHCQRSPNARNASNASSWSSWSSWSSLGLRKSLDAPKASCTSSLRPHALVA